MENTLKELLEHKVALLDTETQNLIDETTVEGIAGGFDLYVEQTDGMFVLRDYQDSDYAFDLGKTIKEALMELDRFIEYFNHFEEGWESSFMYYYEE